VVKNAKPLVDVLYPAGRELVPVVQYLGLYKRETAAMWANIASDTQGVARTPGDEHPIHYVRTLIPFTNEGFVTAPHRLPSNRHNPYLAPGAMDKLATGLESLDCANESNPSGAIPSISFPKCKTQSPWEFRGLTASFPHVAADGP
jgi:phospholipid/cholesterol/gamma-HCH transport system substrate-binding protein